MKFYQQLCDDLKAVNFQNESNYWLLLSAHLLLWIHRKETNDEIRYCYKLHSLQQSSTEVRSRHFSGNIVQSAELPLHICQHLFGVCWVFDDSVIPTGVEFRE